MSMRRQTVASAGAYVTRLACVFAPGSAAKFDWNICEASDSLQLGDAYKQLARIQASHALGAELFDIE